MVDEHEYCSTNSRHVANVQATNAKINLPERLRV